MIYDTREELIDAICNGHVAVVCVQSVTVMMIDEEHSSYCALFRELNQAISAYIADELSTVNAFDADTYAHVEQQILRTYRDNAQKFLAALSRQALADMLHRH